MKPATMLIASIRRDGGTQIRAALDEATVAQYAGCAELPPVRVFFDGRDNWLSDGFHRVEAALRAARKRIDADIRKGSRRDAILDACGANATHGLPRSNADKRRAVETLLGDAEWSKLRDRELARLACVSHTYVGEVRESLRLTQHEVGNVYSRDAAEKSGPATKASPVGHAGQSGGDEGAGGNSSAATQVAPPTPDEPRVSIDLIGIDDIDPAWLALVSDVEQVLSAFDGHLRAAQAALATSAARADVGAQLQSLRRDAHELAARARKSVRPRSVCVYCKDPDGTAGRREECNGCKGLGYVTEEQMGAVPTELKTGGEAAKVIDQKAGGYVPRPRKLSIQDDSGRELVIDREDEVEGWT